MKSRKLVSGLVIFLAAVLWGMSGLRATRSEPSPARGSLTFKFSLPAAPTPWFTSAAAYHSDGTLVRTLWRRRRLGSGAQTGAWDGRDDEGRPLPAGEYQVRVLYHRMLYQWEGVIGNTSASFVGRHIHNAIRPIQSLDNDGQHVFYATGYNEQGLDMHGFGIGNVQSADNFGHSDPFTVFTFVATDGALVYYADTGGGFDTTNSTFVTAVTVNDHRPYSFSQGRDVRLNGNYPNQHYASCIDIDQSDFKRTRATGLAVQKSGRWLAVAHGPLNTVRLLDKRSGALLKSFSVADPRGLTFAPDGDLWVITGSSVVRYSHLDGDPASAAAIHGLSRPLAVAVNPGNKDDVLVADGGSSQQIKAFDARGALRWIYGQAGGYQANGPAIRPDKFGFQWIDLGLGWIEGSALTVMPDGSFWMMDSEINRLLHFSATRHYLEQILYEPTSYIQGIDPNHPSRLIGGSWLEYRVDYRQPLRPGDPDARGGNGCWRLVNNWLAGHESQSDVTGPFNGLSSVITLRNGRVYALRPLSGAQAVVELTTTGLRDTGSRLTESGAQYLYPDNSYRYQRIANGVVTFYRRALIGFDAANNPQWGSPALLASAPAGPKDPYTAYGGPSPHHLAFGGYRLDTTASNVLISFNQGRDPGWHVGGVKVGARRWLWQASPAVDTDSFQDDPEHPGAYAGIGNFDIGDSEQYAGSIAMALPSRRDVVFGFPGENWRHSEADQWMHFSDDGLFIGQYGRNVVTDSIFDPYQHPGVAGNAYSASLFDVDGELYQTNNDEASHGGVHRWHLIGANTIEERIGSGPLGGSIRLTRTVRLTRQRIRAGSRPY